MNKWSTEFEPSFYIVYHIRGSSLSARRITDGRDIRRDASEFRLANTLVNEQGPTTSDGNRGYVGMTGGKTYFGELDHTR